MQIEERVIREQISGLLDEESGRVASEWMDKILLIPEVRYNGKVFDRVDIREFLDDYLPLFRRDMSDPDGHERLSFLRTQVQQGLLVGFSCDTVVQFQHLLGQVLESRVVERFGNKMYCGSMCRRLERTIAEDVNEIKRYYH